MNKQFAQRRENYRSKLTRAPRISPPCRRRAAPPRSAGRRRRKFTKVSTDFILILRVKKNIRNEILSVDFYLSPIFMKNNGTEDYIFKKIEQKMCFASVARAWTHFILEFRVPLKASVRNSATGYLFFGRFFPCASASSAEMAAGKGLICCSIIFGTEAIQPRV